jgi:hypothetical protein
MDFRSYSPKTNPAHNILYGITYFINTHEQFQAKYPNMQDVDKFVYGSYNAGFSRMCALIEEGNCNSWESFVKYICKLMKIPYKYTQKTSAYDVKIRSIFDKDYSKDETIVFNNKDLPTLTKRKAQEILHYVETINAISKSIDE